MRIIPLMLVHFLPFLVLILKLRTAVSSSGKSVEYVVKENKAYSEVFPSFNDVVSMSRLSMLVYDFKYDQNFTCTNFPSSHKNITKDLTCEMYLHDETLGTQVLLVSNKRERYIAIVFAGTDDIRTSLEDVNIFTKPFGNNSTVVLDAINATFDEKVTKKVRVHAGFNNAIFTGDIWEQIYSKTQSLLKQHPSFRLWTTGHSLGAANAILVATAFASLNRNRKVLNVNFGCPQSGNAYWRDYFTAKASPLNNNLSIWRVVLASDLIASLPEFFYRTYQYNVMNLSFLFLLLLRRSNKYYYEIKVLLSFSSMITLLLLLIECHFGIYTHSFPLQ